MLNNSFIYLFVTFIIVGLIILNYFSIKNYLKSRNKPECSYIFSNKELDRLQLEICLIITIIVFSISLYLIYDSI